VSFLESPRFEICPSIGYQSRPAFNVERIRMQSGVTKKNQLWERPLFRYTVTIGPRAEEEIQDVYEFFMALGGPEVGFRFQDLADYKSCRPYQTATALDQPLTPGGSSPSGYMMVKDYTKGWRTQRRDIFKPVASTIKVANQAGVEQTAGTWSLDDQTGIITPLGGFSGTPTTWGGEFDVPVEFEGNELPIEFDYVAAHSVSFNLLEMRIER
jgi:uncharacterized protein (TIGR02217 family)